MVTFTLSYIYIYNYLNDYFAHFQGIEDTDVLEKVNGTLEAGTNEVETKEENEDEQNNPIPAATISSLSIEDVSVSVAQMESAEVDGGNVSRNVNSICF